MKRLAGSAKKGGSERSYRNWREAPENAESVGHGPSDNQKMRAAREALELGAGRYRLRGTVPDDERWAFQSGDVVKCEPRKMSNGDEGFVAARLAY
jgi:hypothetical protein